MRRIYIEHWRLNRQYSHIIINMIIVFFKRNYKSPDKKFLAYLYFQI